MALLAAAVRAGAAAPQCLVDDGCDLSKRQTFDCCARNGATSLMTERCKAYKSCRSTTMANIDAAVAKNCQATRPGRCTVVLGCVRKQERRFQKALKACATADFAKTGGEPNMCLVKGPRARRDVNRVCNGCVSAETPTGSSTSTTATATTTVTATTGTTPTTQPRRPPGTNDEDDKCLQACLMRIDSLRGCYEDCADKCEGNARAEALCQGACRNSVCLAIKARCSHVEDEPIRTDTDPTYARCCENSDLGCLGRDDAPCEVTTTSTSTTVSTTTRVSTTTGPTTSTTSP